MIPPTIDELIVELNSHAAEAYLNLDVPASDLYENASDALSSLLEQNRKLEEARTELAELAAMQCARLCRMSASNFEDHAPGGWPITLDGVARHQSLALADLIEDSLEHGTIRALLSGGGEG